MEEVNQLQNLSLSSKGSAESMSPPPVLKIVKSTDTLYVDTVGEEITYTYVITNCGDTTLHEVNFDDSNSTSLTNIVCDPVVNSSLDPGDVMTCTAKYAVTQDDLDDASGAITTSATAFANGTRSDEFSISILVEQIPEMKIEKVGTAEFPPVVGSTVDYTIKVTNCGNITLTKVSVTDPLLGATLLCDTASGNPLPPGEMMMCTGTYVLNEDDIKAGCVENTATANSEQLQDVKVTSKVNLLPEITLLKSADEPSFDKPGVDITYTYKVTNTGNIILPSPIEIKIVDDKINDGVPFTCGNLNIEAPPGGNHDGDGKFIPGEYVECTMSYTTTQDDVNCGGVTNVAKAQIFNSSVDSSVDSSQVPIVESEEFTLLIPAIQIPAIRLNKDGELLLGPKGIPAHGDLIHYTYQAENTGNVTLYAVSIKDPLECLSDLVCEQPATLDPGESLYCTATYPIAQTDINAGRVYNTATACGTAVIGRKSDGTTRQTVSDSDTHCAEIPQELIRDTIHFWNSVLTGLC